MKIYFCCNWNESSDSLKKRMDKMTINNKGIWNNILSTNKISNADYVVALCNIPKNINFDPNKIIILPREPKILYNPNFNINYGFTYDNIHHVVTEPQFIKMNYDTLINLKYDESIKTKNISTITSMKQHTPNSIKRVKFIKKFSKKYPNIIDIYGTNWDKKITDYKGDLGCYHNSINRNTTKYNGLKNYKYSLCIENSCENNYFSEKFTDCILSWTIPIYFGCPNIDKYFPKDSYYHIDIFDENSYEKVIEIINKPITQKNIDALEKARDLILNKYNIWATIEDIVNNDN